MVYENTFKQNSSLESRMDTSKKILNKYPDRVPIIVFKNNRNNDKNLNDIEKNKYIVPSNINVSNFSVILRNKINLSSKEAIFLLVNNVLPPNTMSIGELYRQHADEDGFLYIIYCKENTFG